MQILVRKPEKFSWKIKNPDGTHTKPSIQEAFLRSAVGKKLRIPFSISAVLFAIYFYYTNLSVILAVELLNNCPIVKEYTQENQAQVVDLILQIQQQEYNIAITKDDQPDLFTIEEFYQTGNGNFWVALDDKKVVGTISLLDIGNNQVALRKMFVDQEYRGPTYKTASLLLNNAINWAKERPIYAIFLGTTPQFLAAHRFYEKNGFIRISDNDLPENFPLLKVDKKFYKYVLK